MPPVNYLGPKLAKIADTYAKNRVDVLSDYDATQRPITPEEDEDKHPPQIHPVDLYALKKAQLSCEDIKNWFFDGLVLPNDWDLVQPSEKIDAVLLQEITSDIKKINALLMSPPTDAIKELEMLLLKLFANQQWMGVARGLVNQSELSIDTLNTLMLWQAGFLESQSDSFCLRLVNAEYPLTHDDTKKYFPADPKKLIDSLAVSIHPASHIDTKIIYFKVIDAEKNVTVIMPSTKLAEQYLWQHERCYLLPLYANGYCYGEDFIASAYLGARLMQLYTPNAQGNLLYVHGNYQGRLSTQHDWFHCVLEYPHLSDKGEDVFKQRMEMLAITANTLARMSEHEQDMQKKLVYSRDAHDLIDRPSKNSISILLSKLYNMHNIYLIAENKRFFTHLFAEMIYLETGVYLPATSVEVNVKYFYHEKNLQIYSVDLSIAEKPIHLEMRIYDDIEINDFLDVLSMQIKKINVQQSVTQLSETCITSNLFGDESNHEPSSRNSIRRSFSFT
jgi:hypothetical protein